jgi:hypothetical protein
MRIEDITPEKLLTKNKGELKILHVKCVQIYKKYFHENKLQKADFFRHGEKISELGRGELLENYGHLKKACRTQGIKLGSNLEIDKALFRKAMRGVDVSSMGDIVLKEACISLVGNFVKSPKSVKEIEVLIKQDIEDRDEALEEKVLDIMKSSTGREIAFSYCEQEPEEDHIPIFDLILRARTETIKLGPKENLVDMSKLETVEIKKPFPNESPSEFTSFARKSSTSDGKKFSIILGIKAGKSKAQSYRYPKDEWTVTQAKSHCKAHKGILFEPASSKAKIKKALDQKFIVVTLFKVPENQVEEVKRDLNGEVWGVELPGDVYAIKTKSKGSSHFALTGVEFPADRWTKDSVKKWLDDHGLLFLVDSKPEVATLKFMKIQKKEQIVGGIIYEPNSVDTQGDFTDAKEITKAMFKFMERYAEGTNRIKVMHKGNAHKFPILENFQPRVDMQIGNDTVKAGSWWMMVKITSPEVWKDIESGKLTGFSMGGTASAR